MEPLRLPKRTRNTIEEIAGIALEHLPMSFSPSDLGAGRKVFFPIPLKKNPLAQTDFLYVYAESKLPDTPKDKEIGFTEEDIINATGFYVFKKVHNRITGQVFPIDTLLKEVINDLSIRNRIIYRINEMKAMIRLDEDFIDMANMERAVGNYPHKRIH